MLNCLYSIGCALYCLGRWLSCSWALFKYLGVKLIREITTIYRCWCLWSLECYANLDQCPVICDNNSHQLDLVYCRWINPSPSPYSSCKESYYPILDLNYLLAHSTCKFFCFLIVRYPDACIDLVLSSWSNSMVFYKIKRSHDLF